MYKDVLRSMNDVGLFPVISFVLFFLFFLVMLFWVLLYKKENIEEYENLPFKGSTNNEN